MEPQQDPSPDDGERWSPSVSKEAFTQVMDDFLERFMYIGVAALMAGHRKMPPAEFARVNEHLMSAWMSDVNRYFNERADLVLAAVTGITRRANDLFDGASVETRTISPEEWQARVNDPSGELGYAQDNARTYGLAAPAAPGTPAGMSAHNPRESPRDDCTCPFCTIRRLIGGGQEGPLEL